MVVCHCRGVSDRAIRKVVRDGACTRRAVTRLCSAGGGCGGCGPVIEEIISQERSAEAEAEAGLPALAELAPAH